jgi:CBS domain-containing protein
MKVSDILRLKGGTLFTVSPDESLSQAIQVMAQKDIGSLVVMEKGQFVGMLTFREVLNTVAQNGGSVGAGAVATVMEKAPAICNPDTDINEVRPLMLEKHTRYMPVLDGNVLMGVISFYDVAKAVVDSQNFENTMLKAYIRDWPQDEAAQG